MEQVCPKSGDRRVLHFSTQQLLLMDKTLHYHSSDPLNRGLYGLSLVWATAAMTRNGNWPTKRRTSGADLVDSAPAPWKELSWHGVYGYRELGLVKWL